MSFASPFLATLQEAVYASHNESKNGGALLPNSVQNASLSEADNIGYDPLGESSIEQSNHSSISESGKKRCLSPSPPLIDHDAKVVNSIIDIPEQPKNKHERLTKVDSEQISLSPEKSDPPVHVEFALVVEQIISPPPDATAPASTTHTSPPRKEKRKHSPQNSSVLECVTKDTSTLPLTEGSSSPSSNVSKRAKTDEINEEATIQETTAHHDNPSELYSSLSPMQTDDDNIARIRDISPEPLSSCALPEGPIKDEIDDVAHISIKEILSFIDGYKGGDGMTDKGTSALSSALTVVTGGEVSVARKKQQLLPNQAAAMKLMVDFLYSTCQHIPAAMEWAVTQSSWREIITHAFFLVHTCAENLTLDDDPAAITLACLYLAGMIHEAPMNIDRMLDAAKEPFVQCFQSSSRLLPSSASILRYEAGIPLKIAFDIHACPQPLNSLRALFKQQQVDPSMYAHVKKILNSKRSLGCNVCLIFTEQELMLGYTLLAFVSNRGKSGKDVVTLSPTLWEQLGIHAAAIEDFLAEISSMSEQRMPSSTFNASSIEAALVILQSICTPSPPKIDPGIAAPHTKLSEADATVTKKSTASTAAATAESDPIAEIQPSGHRDTIKKKAAPPPIVLGEHSSIHLSISQPQQQLTCFIYEQTGGHCKVPNCQFKHIFTPEIARCTLYSSGSCPFQLEEKCEKGRHQLGLCLKFYFKDHCNVPDCKLRHEKHPYCFELWDKLVAYQIEKSNGLVCTLPPLPGTGTGTPQVPVAFTPFSGHHAGPVLDVTTPNGCSRGSACPGNHDVPSILSAIESRASARVKADSRRSDARDRDRDRDNRENRDQRAQSRKEYDKPETLVQDRDSKGTRELSMIVPDPHPHPRTEIGSALPLSIDRQSAASPRFDYMKEECFFLEQCGECKMAKKGSCQWGLHSLAFLRDDPHTACPMFKHGKCNDATETQYGAACPRGRHIVPLCITFFNTGRCTFVNEDGAPCPYRHDQQPVCMAFTHTGTCSRGNACPGRHLVYNGYRDRDVDDHSRDWERERERDWDRDREKEVDDFGRVRERDPRGNRDSIGSSRPPREHETPASSSRKPDHRPMPESSSGCLLLNLPKACIGKIMGPGGSTVRILEADYNVRIFISKGTEIINERQMQSIEILPKQDNSNNGGDRGGDVWERIEACAGYIESLARERGAELGIPIPDSLFPPSIRPRDRKDQPSSSLPYDGSYPLDRLEPLIFLVPSVSVALCIGKAGANRLKMEQANHVSIIYEKNIVNGGFQEVCVTPLPGATRSDLQRCKEQILAMVDQKEDELKSRHCFEFANTGKCSAGEGCLYQHLKEGEYGGMERGRGGASDRRSSGPPSIEYDGRDRERDRNWERERDRERENYEREHERERERERERNERQREADEAITLKIPTSAHIVGLIAGKSGDQIAAIQNEFNVDIFNMSDTQSLIQVIQVSGSKERALACRQHLLDLISFHERAIEEGLQQARREAEREMEVEVAATAERKKKEMLLRERERDRDHLTVRVPISTSIIGPVIGRDGAQVKSLKADYAVSINKISDPSTPDVLHLEICGVRGDVERCERRILDIAADFERREAYKNGSIVSHHQQQHQPQQQQQQQQQPIEKQLRVPIDRIGAVLGKGGEIVKQTKRDYGVNIRKRESVNSSSSSSSSSSSPTDGEVILDITGLPDDVDRCIRYIISVIDDSGIKPPSQTQCFEYVSRGGCKFGNDCKFLHPVSASIRR